MSAMSTRWESSRFTVNELSYVMFVGCQLVNHCT